MSNAYYNLFKRQWERCRASEEDIAEAVRRGYITEQEADEIKALERDCD